MRPPAGEDGRAAGLEGGNGAARSDKSEFSTSRPPLDVLEVFDLVLGAGEAAADGVPLFEGVERVDRAGLDILDLL